MQHVPSESMHIVENKNCKREIVNKSQRHSSNRRNESYDSRCSF